MEWLDEFLQVASIIPPQLLERILSREQLAKVALQFKDFKDKKPEIYLERDDDWNRPPEWDAGWGALRPPLTAWMAGEPIANIAAILTGQPPDTIPADRTSGKPIPRALSVTMDVWSSLALVAGGFLAVAEQIFEGKVPLPLACLPMCIKYGCDSPGTLAWFRFGVRLRRASRLLAMAFPPPETIVTDDDLRKWVRARRKKWLKDEGTIGGAQAAVEASSFEAIKAFITR